LAVDFGYLRYGDYAGGADGTPFPLPNIKIFYYITLRLTGVFFPLTNHLFHAKIVPLKI
jgi:hypothetical protein